FIAMHGSTSIKKPYNSRRGSTHIICPGSLLNGRILVYMRSIFRQSLDKTASFNRTSLYKERVTGRQLEAMRNLVTAIHLLNELEDENESYKIAMVSRFRSSAVDAFLAAPIPAPKLPIDLLNSYWEHISMCNHLVEALNLEIRAEKRKGVGTLREKERGKKKGGREKERGSGFSGKRKAGGTPRS
ncbi:MAG TPA: hypothetical protein VMG10_27695, partial [Gemmataceae bacterium]|nr:hypothetical protein [Gemmataceae bacterium]